MEYHGSAASEGIAVGKAMVFRPFIPKPSRLKLKPEEIELTLARAAQVKKACCDELQRLITDAGFLDPDKARIFVAHIEILNDEQMEEDIITVVRGEKVNADWAIEQVYHKYISILENSKSQISRERASDFRDVLHRLLRLWEGVPGTGLSRLSHPVILIAHDLAPSDTVLMDHEKVLAIVGEIGGYTSHSAIIARSLGIPAVLGVQNIMDKICDGDEIAVDGISGRVTTGPFKPEELEAFHRAGKNYLSKKRMQDEFLRKEARTRDGVPIRLGLNIAGNNMAAETIHRDAVDFVGLFRTEFLYMGSHTLPDEEAQFKAYRELAGSFGSKPVTIRTLDIGGDKQLPCLKMPSEENPFLGKRALRLCFDHIDIFKTQLRAMLRASAFGNVQIMFPMVGSMEDLRRAKEILSQVKKELDTDCLAYDSNIKAGVMIEIPSIALMAPELAREVDFASIGSNDLCQYTLAADRCNSAVADYYQSYSPALFRLISLVSRAFRNEGKSLSICGELGGQPLAAPLLVGLGVHNLSMSISSVAAVKKALSEHTLYEMQEIAEKVLLCSTQESILKLLNHKESGRERSQEICT